MFDIYYLAFSPDELHPDSGVTREELRDFRFDVAYGDGPAVPSAEQFERYFRYVGTESGDHEDVFAAWNRGSGQESIRFRRALERSMSPVDVAIDRETGKAYVVAPIGWERAPELDYAEDEL